MAGVGMGKVGSQMREDVGRVVVWRKIMLMF
jgi:hypothetical protein